MFGDTTTNPLPPAINYAAIISNSLRPLVIGHTFLVLLIPVLAALFYYSTPYSRRQPIFILNVLSLALAFIVGLATDAMHVCVIILNT